MNNNMDFLLSQMKDKGFNISGEVTKEKILSSLSESDAKKVNNLLSNKDELNKLLSSKEAKDIISKLKGGK